MKVLANTKTKSAEPLYSLNGMNLSLKDHPSIGRYLPSQSWREPLDDGLSIAYSRVSIILTLKFKQFELSMLACFLINRSGLLAHQSFMCLEIEEGGLIIFLSLPNNDWQQPKQVDFFNHYFVFSHFDDNTFVCNFEVEYGV